MKMREGRLRWYGDVMRRDQEYIGRRVMEMELPGKRKRGRPTRRFLDVVKEDMGKLVQGRQSLKTGCFGEALYAVATPDQRKRSKEDTLGMKIEKSEADLCLNFNF